MKIAFFLTMACLSSSIGIGSAVAACSSNGESLQSVSLSAGMQKLDRWDVISGEIHRVKLENGFNLGLKIEPVTTEAYQDQMKKLNTKATDELVKISVYDMGGTEPKLLTHTWGGSNSKQGYGPRGGADRVSAIGEPGIELWLHKPNCIKADELAKSVRQ